MRSFRTITAQNIIRVIKSRRMRQAYSTHVRDEKTLHNGGRKIRKEETTWKIKVWKGKQY
jgi:hypothetical protein